MKYFVIAFTILLCFANADSLAVYVKDINQNISLCQVKEVTKETTVHELKKKISHMKKIPMKAFELFHKKHACKEEKEKKLHHCGVKEGGVMTMAMVQKEQQMQQQQQIWNKFQKGMFILIGKMIN